MKVHKMSNKQFAKFVSGLQAQAMKNPLRISYVSTEKYDYDCRKVVGYIEIEGIDWEIRRRLGGDLWYTLWAFHNKGRKAWTVYEGKNVYEYLDSDLEKAVQKDG